MPLGLSRRRFITASTSACLIGSKLLADKPLGEETAKPDGQPWLHKSFKSNMFKGTMSLTEHFAEAKQAGFEGIEMTVPFNESNSESNSEANLDFRNNYRNNDSKKVDMQAAIAASRETGLIIDGTVGNYHWKQRHTDSDDDVRSEALVKLKTGLKQTAEMGGDSMQIVPGHGNDGNVKRTLKRAQEAIESALPVAEKNKVSILIENAQNRMFYDHMSKEDQTAEALAEFIDRFDSPWVGVQLDIASVAMIGDPADWIATLGSRIKKLDVKGLSKSRKSRTKIGEGVLDWPAIVNALQAIDYSGWVVAEFGQSNILRLKEISSNMETHLQCSQSLASVR